MHIVSHNLARRLNPIDYHHREPVRAEALKAEQAAQSAAEQNSAPPPPRPAGPQLTQARSGWARDKICGKHREKLWEEQ